MDDSLGLADRLRDLFSAVSSGKASNVASALSAAAVRRIVFETSFTPPLVFEPAYNPDGSVSQPSAWNPLSVLRPKITVYPAIGEPISWAKYGEPSQNYFLHLLGLGAGLGAGVALLKGAKTVAKTAGIVALVLLALGVARNTQGASS